MSNSATLDSLWDDPQIWRQYSQPGRADPLAGALWESQVVVQGMHCAACAFTIEDAVRSVPGVSSVSVNAATHRASVTWQEDRVKPSVWMQAIERAGYTPGDEIALALENGIFAFHVESEPELKRLSHVSGRLGVKAPIAIRINPDWITSWDFSARMADALSPA